MIFLSYLQNVLRNKNKKSNLKKPRNKIEEAQYNSTIVFILFLYRTKYLLSLEAKINFLYYCLSHFPPTHKKKKTAPLFI